MSHNVVGLDLGSHSVKATLVRMGLWGSEVVRMETEPVLNGDRGISSPNDILDAAARLIQRLNIDQDTIHCAVPGELAAIRRMNIPASAARRLEQVLKFELDEALPYGIDEAVFDFVVLQRSREEFVVLCGAVRTEQVRDLISGLVARGIDPREIGVAPLSYADGIPEGQEGEVKAVLDIGHQRTNIAILDGNQSTVRTMMRGGRDLTERLSIDGGIDFERAESFKKQHGLSGRVGAILVEALRPFERELMQTFKGHMATGGRAVTQVVLCGGSALLPGLDLHLSAFLGIPVEKYTGPLGWARTAPEPEGGAPLFALPYCLAHRESKQRSSRINIRQGELAYRGDLQFLRKKVGWVAACVLGVVFSWVLSSYAQYRAASGKAEEQKAKIAQVTKEYFGAPMFNLAEIRKKLEGAVDQPAPVPPKDAFDVVLELSKRMPVSIKHDVEQLDIKPKRITLRGLFDAAPKAGESATDNSGPPGTLMPSTPAPEATPESAMPSAGEASSGTDDAAKPGGEELSPTDLIKQQLAGWTECFSDIRVDKVTSMGDKKRYQMTIESRCP